MTEQEQIEYRHYYVLIPRKSVPIFKPIRSITSALDAIGPEPLEPSVTVYDYKGARLHLAVPMPESLDLVPEWMLRKQIFDHLLLETGNMQVAMRLADLAEISGIQVKTVPNKYRN